MKKSGLYFDANSIGRVLIEQYFTNKQGNHPRGEKLGYSDETEYKR